MCITSRREKFIGKLFSLATGNFLVPNTRTGGQDLFPKFGLITREKRKKGNFFGPNGLCLRCWKFVVCSTNDRIEGDSNNKKGIDMKKSQRRQMAQFF